MIVTVGTGRGVENGIVYSIQHHSPSLILFLYSKDSQETLELVKKQLTSSNYQILEEEFNEVNDVEQLFSNYRKKIQELISNGYSPENIIADYTSGTKAMSSALVSAAISFNISSFSYVYGERGREDGRVKSGTEKVLSLSPNVIYIEEKLRLFRNFFNLYQFEAAYNILEKLEHSAYNETLKVYKALALAYSAWDKFEYGKALDKLNSLNRLEFEAKQQVTQNKQTLQVLSENRNQISEALLNDLYSNALRRFKEGKYDDCVARLYRLLEMFVQYEIKNQFNCETSQFPFEKLTPTLQKKYENSKDQEKNTVKLPLMDGFILLLEKFPENELAKKYNKNQSEIKKLLSMRNGSLLAHGFTPIDKEKAKKMIKLLKNMKRFSRIKFPKFK